jgi:hypothetical protein
MAFYALHTLDFNHLDGTVKRRYVSYLTVVNYV